LVFQIWFWQSNNPVVPVNATFFRRLSNQGNGEGVGFGDREVPFSPEMDYDLGLGAQARGGSIKWKPK